MTIDQLVSIETCLHTSLTCVIACEYLAVSTLSEHPAIVFSRPETREGAQQPGMLQIWSLDTSDPTDFDIDPPPSGKGRGLRLDLAIIVDAESSLLKWCPKGGEQASAKGVIPRLGLLAALSGDGRLAIYDIPYPDVAKNVHGIAQDDLLFCRFSSSQCCSD